MVIDHIQEIKACLQPKRTVEIYPSIDILIKIFVL